MSEEEKEAYYRSLVKSDIDNVINILPDRDSYGFSSLMSYLLSKLIDDYKEAVKLNEEDSSENLDNEINIIKEKIKICKNHYCYEESLTKNKIIFAQTKAGNYYFKNDLDDINKEQYDDIIKIFDFIFGRKNSNSTTVETMGNIHNLKGTLKYKSKTDQVRVYAKKVKGDVICIFGLFVKKDDWPKKLRETLSLRLKTVNGYVDDLKSLSEDELEKICKDNENLLNNILNEIGYEIDDDFDIEKIETLTLDLPKKHKEKIDDWDDMYLIALSIYEEKGFVDLSDDRAKKVNLGEWLDKQIKNVINYRLSSDRENLILSLISNKETRIDEINIPKLERKKRQNIKKWDYYYPVALAIYKEKGFVDLNDDRAKNINLGEWMDKQINRINRGIMSQERKELFLSLISNKETRVEKVDVSKIDIKNSKKLQREINGLLLVFSHDDLVKVREFASNLSNGYSFIASSFNDYYSNNGRNRC